VNESADSQLLASLAILVGFLLPLVLGAWFVEYLLPKARRNWRRHVRTMAHYRAQQRRAAEDVYDAERRKAAAWLAANCYWKQQGDR